MTTDGKPSLPRPCLMLIAQSTEDAPLAFGEAVVAAIEGGVNAVQLRDKSAPRSQLLEPGKRLRDLTEGRALLLVNGPPELAQAVRADGVHLPERGTSVREARAFVGEDLLVGRSVHSAESARRAASEGADYLVAGTVFASRSHPDVSPSGTDYLRDVCSAVAVPVIAIGGVTPQNAGECLSVGAAGVAVLSPLIGAENPRSVAEAYMEVLRTEGKVQERH